MSKYCEWKGEEWLDKDKWRYSRSCGEDVIVTRNNKYDKLLKADYEVCPFCGKEINVRCYD
jgi:hypothetical protein